MITFFFYVIAYDIYNVQAYRYLHFKNQTNYNIILFSKLISQLSQRKCFLFFYILSMIDLVTIICRNLYMGYNILYHYHNFYVIVVITIITKKFYKYVYVICV